MLTEGVAPCRSACPSRIGIGKCLALLSEGKLKEAWQQLTESNPFPSITGRVCPCYCESNCNRGRFDKAIAIKSLERFLGDYGRREGFTRPMVMPPNEHKVAIVGAGPAGLSAAHYLIGLGYQVTIFEASSKAGGMLYWGVPEYRLPKNVIDKEVEAIKQLGVEIRVNTTIGKNLTLKNLFAQSYKVVLIAIGAQRDLKLNIPGEDAEGVVPGIEYLKQVNSGKSVKSGNRVFVIGGGNTAIDAARVSARLGASRVVVLYRRSQIEMPAVTEEVEAALRDGVEMQFLVSPTAVMAKEGKVVGIRCVRNELGEPDAKGRRKVVPIPGSKFSVEADAVIVAAGQAPDVSLLSGLGARITNNGKLSVNPDTLATNLPNIFITGDVNQPEGGTVVEAIAAGRKVALGIHSQLTGSELSVPEDERVVNYENLNVDYFRHTERREVKGARLKTLMITAMAESSRCFHCGKAWIEVREDWCKACGLCIEACKLSLIGFSEGLNPRGFHPVWLTEPEKCCGCMACALVCPDAAIEVYRQK